jgi:type IV pilus assembly protein PilO
MEERLRGITFTQSLIVGVALIGLYWGMFYDNGAKLEANIRAAESETVVLQKEIESVRKAIADAERYKQTMAALGSEIEKIVQAMPTKYTPLDFMRAISNEAKGVGTEINQITSPQNFRNNDPNAAAMFYEEVPIEVDLTGNYNQIMLFLSNLTRLDKIITVKQLSMESKSRTGTEAASSSPRIDLKASFLAYRYIKPMPVPGTPSNNSAPAPTPAPNPPGGGP